MLIVLRPREVVFRAAVDRRAGIFEGAGVLAAAGAAARELRAISCRWTGARISVVVVVVELLGGGDVGRERGRWGRNSSFPSRTAWGTSACLDVGVRVGTGPCGNTCTPLGLFCGGGGEFSSRPNELSIWSRYDISSSKLREEIS